MPSDNNSNNSKSANKEKAPRLYSVPEAARIVGISSGRIYQRIKDGTIVPASEEYLRSIGYPPRLKPHHLITEEALKAFQALPRTTYSSIQRPENR